MNTIANDDQPRVTSVDQVVGALLIIAGIVVGAGFLIMSQMVAAVFGLAFLGGKLPLLDVVRALAVCSAGAHASVLLLHLGTQRLWPARRPLRPLAFGLAIVTAALLVASLFTGPLPGWSLWLFGLGLPLATMAETRPKPRIQPTPPTSHRAADPTPALDPVNPNPDASR